MSEATNVVPPNSIQIQAAENSQSSSNDLVKQAQQQADELLEIARDNVGKAMDRGQKLSVLTEISRNLESGAGQFVTNTKTLQRKAWLKRFKRKIIILFFLIILFVCIIFVLKQSAK